MDPLYDLHPWCKHYRGEAQREAQVRHRPLPQLTGDRSTPIGGTFQWVIAWVLVALLMALAGARPAQAAFPDEALPVNHGPLAFEKDGSTGKIRTNAFSLRRTPKPSPIRAAMPRTETRAAASLFGIEVAQVRR